MGKKRTPTRLIAADVFSEAEVREGDENRFCTSGKEALFVKHKISNNFCDARIQDMRGGQ